MTELCPRPKVSVILTSYNHAKYIRTSIESVLGQTYTNFELIIGDDGSTDGSWAIINTYEDPRIRAFRNQTNQGGGLSRKAIEHMTHGEYIAIHHSDDVWESQKLEKQVAFLDDHPEIGAVFSRATIIGEEGQPFEDASHVYYNRFDQQNRSRYEWLNYFFSHGNVLCHPSVLIRRKCYDDCGLYRYGLAQTADFDMWVRLCLKYEIHILPEKLVRFRVRAGAANASIGGVEAQIRAQFEFFQILSHYRNITDFDTLSRVFPAAQKYFRPGGIDAGFVLGMVALESEPFRSTHLLGLSLLFEALNDPVRAGKIKDLYGFCLADFVALTAKHDVFSVGQIASLNQAVAERDDEIMRLNQNLGECNGKTRYNIQKLEQVLSSPAWRITKMFRLAGWFCREGGALIRGVREL